jgi:predicted metal-binding membrane protein
MRLPSQFDANLPDGHCMSRCEISENTHQIATRIAQKLRDAKFSCQIAVLVPADTAVLRRDRIVVILASTLLTALAWGYLLWLSADMSMGGMDMGDFRMIPSGMGLMVPAHTPWRAMEFALVFVMWTVMMVGMMTPSAAPMILMYARVGRHSAAQATPFLATVWFAAGYLLVWVAFALLATLVQWALERTALLDSWMASTSNVLGAFVFVAAGSYQWTRLKEICLTECQRPFVFLMRHGGFRRDAPGSLMLGLRHGLYCVGCCWALMALLFAGGVMNVLWVAVLALLVLLEKVTPFGCRISSVAGTVLIAAGAWLFSIGMH